MKALLNKMSKVSIRAILGWVAFLSLSGALLVQVSIDTETCKSRVQAHIQFKCTM